MRPSPSPTPSFRSRMLHLAACSLSAGVTHLDESPFAARLLTVRPKEIHHEQVDPGEEAHVLVRHARSRWRQERPARRHHGEQGQDRLLRQRQLIDRLQAFSSNPKSSSLRTRSSSSARPCSASMRAQASAIGLPSKHASAGSSSLGSSSGPSPRSGTRRASRAPVGRRSGAPRARHARPAHARRARSRRPRAGRSSASCLRSPPTPRRAPLRARATSPRLRDTLPRPPVRRGRRASTRAPRSKGSGRGPSSRPPRRRASRCSAGRSPSPPR